jgi:hypothetical protein
MQPFSETLTAIHRMFADFQSQRRKRKIGGLPEPSALISVSPVSIFVENKGAQPPLENL